MDFDQISKKTKPCLWLLHFMLKILGLGKQSFPSPMLTKKVGLITETSD